MPARLHSCLALWFVGALELWGCRRADSPANRLAQQRDVTAQTAWDSGHVDTFADATSLEASIDASSDGSLGSVLTVRVVNASSEPMKVYVNPDANEMLHTRKLYSRRRSDTATSLAAEGELVKFFSIGQMSLCSADGGVGYGGLGQPEQRSMAPGEVLTFAWDGQLRREVLDPRRGVCAEVTTVEPGRYRFEFDQPYDPPLCNRVVVVLPLAADASPVIEIRCAPRPRKTGTGAS